MLSLYLLGSIVNKASNLSNLIVAIAIYRGKVFNNNYPISKSSKDKDKAL